MVGWGRSEGEGLSLTLDSEGQEVRGEEGCVESPEMTAVRGGSRLKRVSGAL